jgi:hypothetical protein
MKGCGESPDLDVIFHAPNGAQYSNGGSPSGCEDQLLDVYDQSQQLWIGAYRCAPYDSPGFPDCTATSPSNACLVPSPSACAAERVGVDKDWGWNPGSYTTTIHGVAESFGYGGDNMPTVPRGATA